MMVSEFKNFIQERLVVLWLNIKNTFLVDTAYFANKWASGFSTLFYTAASLVFIHVLFANVHAIAGYSRDEFLFFTFLGQMNFYTLYMWSGGNIEQMIENVRKGDLDIMLTKPLPHLFYVTITRINLIGFIRDAIPSILTFIVVINWSQLDFSIFSIFGGIVIFIFGQILFHCVMFALALPVFWSGESSALFKLIYGLWEFIQVPFEGVPVIIKAIFTWLIPLLFVTVISSSVFLTKSDPLSWSIVTIVLACIFLMVKSFLWRKAMQQYASASS
ncbi:MAG: ABC-2 family transporter protein [Candidatus Dojkabacteria bacterium]